MAKVTKTDTNVASVPVGSTPTPQPAPASVEKPATLKSLLERDDVKSKFRELLGKRSSSFVTSVLQVVASSDQLKHADPMSVMQSAAVAATLDLPLNNNLGFAYIVPYNNRQKDGSYKTVGQFQIGWKGYQQLAQRSGQFVRLNVSDVREGEIKHFDRLSGDIEFQWIQEEEVRRALPVIGYVSYFKLINGFEKSLYMTMGDLKEHAKKYSKTYQKGFGNWVDDFDSMARKTVIKLNLSRNAPLSVEMQTAINVDQAVIKDVETEDVEYIDNDVVLEQPVSLEELQVLYELKSDTLDDDEKAYADRIISNKEVNSYTKLYKHLSSK